MHVELENIGCFGHARLDFARREGAGAAGGRRATVVLGAGGSGTTTLLRALALGLTPARTAAALAAEVPWLVSGHRRRGQRGRVRVELADPGAPQQRFAVTTEFALGAGGAVQVTQVTEPARGFPWRRLFVCGYGVGRGLRARTPGRTHQPRAALRSLFVEGAPLWAPGAALAGLGQTDGDDGRRRERALAHLAALAGVRGRGAVTLAGEVLEVRGPWGAAGFAALGTGHRDLLSWLVDLLARADRAGALDGRARPAGIVLIDAVDAHLPPARQRRLLAELGQRFPALQVVAAARSPLTIVECEPGGVVACRVVGRGAVIDADLPSPAGYHADEILRGPWFGLAATVDEATAARVADYRAAVALGAPEAERVRLREAVRERLGHLVDTPLDELVREVVAALVEERGAPGEDDRRWRSEALRWLRRRLEEPDA
ncbi:hypothetical protein [Haliangium sp.]|uniref:hypothetical protein n=1 Tax=Haliangium sp. TaxID=2663208 RepID=UPI003D116877